MSACAACKQGRRRASSSLYGLEWRARHNKGERGRSMCWLAQEEAAAHARATEAGAEAADEGAQVGVGEGILWL